MTSWLEPLSPGVRGLRVPAWLRAGSPDDRYLAFCPAHGDAQQDRTARAVRCVDLATGHAVLELDAGTPVGALAWVAPDVLWVVREHEFRPQDATVIAYAVPDGGELGRVRLPRICAYGFDVSASLAAATALVMPTGWLRGSEAEARARLGYVLRSDSLEIVRAIEPRRTREALGLPSRPHGVAALSPDGARIALCSDGVVVRDGLPDRPQAWIDPGDLVTIDWASGKSRQGPGAPEFVPTRVLWTGRSTVVVGGGDGLLVSDLEGGRVVFDTTEGLDGGPGWTQFDSTLELPTDRSRLLVVGLAPGERYAARRLGVFRVIDLATGVIARSESVDTEADKAMGATWLDDDSIVVLSCKGSMVAHLGPWDPARRAAAPARSIVLTGRHVNRARVERSPAGRHLVVSWRPLGGGQRVALVDPGAVSRA